MKLPSINPKWCTRAALAGWAVFLLLLALPAVGVDTLRLMDFMLYDSRIASLLTVVSAILLVFSPPSTDAHSAEALHKQAAGPWAQKSVAIILLLSLICTAACALHSLSLAPDHGKFIYNNVANTTGFLSILLIFVLNRLQRNIYWALRSAQLDERQVRERYRVLEISYRLGAGIVLAAALLLAAAKHHLPHIITNDTTFNVTPGALFWPFFAIALTLFALPLLVAAYRSKDID